MQDQSCYPLGSLGNADVGVKPTLDGQVILIQDDDLGRRLACLLGFDKADTVQQGDVNYWRLTHSQRVDELLVELIDLLISIRYAHPAMVQLEMILEPDEP